MKRRYWALLALFALGCDPTPGSAPGATSAGGTTGSGAPATASAPASASASTATSAARAAGSVAGSASAAGSAAADEPPAADPSRLVLEGKPIQGGLLRARVDPATRGFLFPGHRVVLSPDGQFLIAFSRNAPKQEKLKITFPDGAVLEHAFEVEQRTYEEDRIDNLPEHFVKLDPETKKKLHLANTRIDQVRMGFTPEPHYLDGFTWPLKGKITSRYGQKRILNGTDGGIHWGVDIAVPIGTPVKAPAAGKVIFAEADIPLSGTTLVIDHGHGLSSTLIHLQAIVAKVDQLVKQGDVVATSGMTGRANGPHLDWRMNFFEVRIDPELVVPPMK